MLLLNGYFKTSMIDFVQQLIKTCAYINIYKAWGIHRKSLIGPRFLAKIVVSVSK